jgi:hypothetical protein
MITNDQQAAAQQPGVMQEMWLALVSIRKELMRHSYKWNSCSSPSVGSHALTSSEA